MYLYVFLSHSNTNQEKVPGTSVLQITSLDFCLALLYQPICFR